MDYFKMIGKQNPQLSILDGALNSRKKRCRTETLLEKINKFVQWDKLEALCTGMYQDTKRGHPSLPIVVALKCLFLQFLYNLGDPALEDALIDRLSFQRFIGISFDREIPDYSTIWRFRDRLIKANILTTIFEEIIRELDEQGVILRKGTLIDATIVQAARKPKNHHKVPQHFSQKSAQQDYDAKTTKKGGTMYYGYKGHIATDEGSNIIRKTIFTPANVHDSRELDTLICGDERSVFADKAYADDDVKRKLRQKGVYCGILDKGRRNRQLSQKQKHANKQKSKVRNAVERPFAHFKKLMGYVRVRYVNLERNELHFTFLCILHNIRRGIALTMTT